MYKRLSPIFYRFFAHRLYIRSSEKFLSFYKEIIKTQYFPFYIVLSNYVWSILFSQTKDRNIRQIRFRVCTKIRRCKTRVCNRKILSGQPNTFVSLIYRPMISSNNKIKIEQGLFRPFVHYTCALRRYKTANLKTNQLPLSQLRYNFGRGK